MVDVASGVSRGAGEPSRSAPDVVLGLVVAGVGLVQALTPAWSAAPDRWLDRLLLPGLVGTSAALHRRAPAVALALVWLAGVVQLLRGDDVLLAQLSVGLVAFGAARWGDRLVLWVSGASIPLGCLVAVGYTLTHHSGLTEPVVSAFGAVPLGVGATSARQVYTLAALAVLVLLALPWLAGLAARTGAAARDSRLGQEAAEAQRARAEDERAAAQQTAVLRTAQARLARDVHDVVGHSLAVILAQAESAQFLPDEDVTALRATMATVAASARQSLRDVRAVLSSGGGAQRSGTPGQGAGEGGQDGLGDLDALVAGVAASEDVRDVVHGTPAPLPPDAAVVAHRVLQEMLTNALKHGRRGAPIEVERSWAQDLTLQVSNVATSEGDGVVHHGLGLTGMRERLAAVGGDVCVLRERRPDGSAAFTARARIPLPEGRSPEH